jgi:hypothetical protein
MSMRKSTIFAAGGGLVLGACSLLQDSDSLSRDYGAKATAGSSSGGGQATAEAGTESTAAGDAHGGDFGAAAGANAAGASSGGSSCVSAPTDSSCDGRDEACAPASSESVCPSGCKGVAFGNDSYMGCGISATFADAEILCQKQGMHLTQIESASENNFVVQIARTLGSYVWVGGSDLEQLGSYRWPDGSAFYENGAPISGVYENFEAAPRAGYDCVQLHDDDAGHWSGAHCADSLQFICRR